MTEEFGKLNDDATQKQVDFVDALNERMKSLLGSDREFYDIVQRITGKRVTTSLTKEQAGRIINECKEYLEMNQDCDATEADIY